MNSTFATVIIEAKDKEVASADLPDHFTVGFTNQPETDPATATHYVDSGYWYDTELDTIVNDVTWPKTVKFGDAQAAIASLGLVRVVTPEPTE